MDKEAPLSSANHRRLYHSPTTQRSSPQSHDGPGDGDDNNTHPNLKAFQSSLETPSRVVARFPWSGGFWGLQQFDEATALSLFGVLVQLLNSNQRSSSHWIRNHLLGVANPACSHGPGADGETRCQPWHSRSQLCCGCWQESWHPVTSRLLETPTKS